MAVAPAWVVPVPAGRGPASWKQVIGHSSIAVAPGAHQLQRGSGFRGAVDWIGWRWPSVGSACRGWAGDWSLDRRDHREREVHPRRYWRLPWKRPH